MSVCGQPLGTCSKSRGPMVLRAFLCNSTAVDQHVFLKSFQGAGLPSHSGSFVDLNGCENQSDIKVTITSTHSRINVDVHGCRMSLKVNNSDETPERSGTRYQDGKTCFTETSQLTNQDAWNSIPSKVSKMESEVSACLQKNKAQ